MNGVRGKLTVLGFALGFALVLAGCATGPAPRAEVPAELFADHLFRPVSRAEIDRDIFALSPAMRRFVEREMEEPVRRLGARRGLLEALKGELRIEYDSAKTLDAAETFDARAGNCMSLVLMTAAFARELGIPVTFRNVFGYDTWTRSGDMAFHSGHINLALGNRNPDRLRNGKFENDLIVDFLPSDRAIQASAHEIQEPMVVSMFRNNRAAEFLSAGDMDRAYGWSRASIESYPSSPTSWNTLGVIYLRHGNLREAEGALRRALAFEPEGLEQLSNLAVVLARLGRDDEARMLRARIASIEPVAPFYYFDLGVAAMQRGEFADAVAMLEKERGLRPYADEVHFALAVARLRLGDARSARKHMTLALEHSTTPATHAIYAAKLEYFKQQEVR